MLYRCAVLLTGILSVSALSAVNVPLEVSNWADVARTGEPVTAGVPLPKGAQADITKLRIVDAGGNTVAAQFRALTRWTSEKRFGIDSCSLKWVLCDFQSSVAATNKSNFTLKDDASGSSTSSRLVLTQDAAKVTVVTGPLKFTVSKSAFNLFDEAFLDGNNNGTFEAGEQIISSNAANGGSITAGDWAAGECVPGTVHTSAARAPQRIIIEEQGPMKVVLRIEGRHYAATGGVSKGLYDYQVFITAYDGKPFVDVQWGVTNLLMEGLKPAETGTPSPYKMYVWPFQEYAVNLNLSLGASQTYAILGATEASGSATGSPVRLLQKKGAFTVTGGASGSAALGAVSLTDGTKGVQIALRDFAPNSPKGISVEQGKIKLELFPDTAGRQWLDPSSRKNHRFRMNFTNGAYSAGALTSLSKEANAPLRMLASRQWYQATRAWYRGLGIPPDASYARKTPATWTRTNKSTANEWTKYGEIGEFNGGGDHSNFTSNYFKYLMTGNPADFEFAESQTFHFNDIVPVQVSWYADPWAQVDFFLNAESHLAGLQNYHGPGTHFSSTIVSFPGWTYHRGNIPDTGHMTQLELLEYYLLTGDHATLDAIRSMGVQAIAVIEGYFYFAANRAYSSVPPLDSIFIMPYQQRYIARPGIVCSHAYEVTGDARFLRHATMAAYSMRNYVNLCPSGYMAKPDDRSYMANTEAGMLAMWTAGHPGETDYPRSFASNEFMIGIAHECLYNYIDITGDPEIKDALIYSSKSMEQRAGFSGGKYTGWVYSGYGDYMREGKREDVIGTPAFTSSMAEGFGGLIFGYLVSGRNDLWRVIIDGKPSHPASGFDMKVVNLWEAQYARDSLDNVPPAAVTDLVAVNEPGSGIRLTWTAPGNNGSTGRAAEYRVKYSTVPMADTVKTWNAAAQTGWPDMRAPLPYTLAALLDRAKNYKATQEISFWAAKTASAIPAPQTAGTVQTMVVPGLASETNYTFALVTFDSASNVSPISNQVTATVALEGSGALPVTLSMNGNYPNPFNPMTMLRFSIPPSRKGSLMRLTIVDLQGRVVRTLASGPAEAGYRQIAWDGQDNGHRPVASGIYICRLNLGGKTLEKRMVLNR